jgi:acetyl esterase/lipase
MRAGTVLIVALGGLLAGCSTILLEAANGVDRLGTHYRREADVPYGSDARQRLDIYRPAAPGSAAPRGLVVFVHGGRWNSGSKNEYRFVAAGLAERGFVVIVPNYRLSPAVRMDAAASDVARAVAYAESSARSLGADPERVILMGHSAGAQLAALVANDARWLSEAGAKPVRALVGLAGPYDFLPLTDADLVDYFAPPAHYPATQPVNYVSAASPPAFLVHGLADTTVRVRNAESMAAHLRAAGVAVELRLVPGETHGGVLKRFVRFYRGDDELYAALVRFLSDPPARAPAG